MEKKQSEVTYKIRSAIKKKLAEFSDFVDDELPDYIMILIANQRSKSQIEKDLSLFLRNDTLNFTNWLWDLLDSSKVCTKSMSPTTSKNEPIGIKRAIELDEDAVILEFEPDEHETDFLNYEGTNDSTASKASIRPSVLQTKSKEPAVTKTQKSEHAVKQKIRRSKSPEKLSKKDNQSYKETLSSAVIPVKKKLNTEDEYDPTKPEYKSPHKPTFRKCGGAVALQTNKLLLKAVDDATKSVLSGKNLEEFYKPTPIKVLTSKELVAVENLHRGKKSMHKTIPELKLNPDVSFVSEFNVNEYQSDEDEYRNDQITENTNRTICLQNIPLISSVSEKGTVDNDVRNSYTYSFKAFEELRPKSPHFIVTLDGVSRASFKRKFEEDSVDSMEDDDTDNEYESSANENSSSPDKKFKLNERCRYWPACKNSDECFYHHPTVACKCFPACKFGDKCLYIHPNCKFDALCSRKDCPFTHASKRKLPLIAVPVKMVPPVRSRRMKVVCKFYPNCASKNCPYIHPKLCRYGTNCRLPACVYGHFPVPTRNQLKWHAPLS